MRVVVIGGHEFELVASPSTLYWYKCEFRDRDLISDLADATVARLSDPADIDGTTVAMIAWAMVKTAHGGRFLGYNPWIAALGIEEFSYEQVSAILEEAERGFFRGSKLTTCREAVSKKPSKFDDSPELGLMVTAKRMGLSFTELDSFTLPEFLDFVDMWVGEDTGTTRAATQEDIDGLFS